MKYFVVYGYCGPDNYTDDDGPVLKVKEFKTAEQVEDFYEDEFLPEAEDDDNDQIVFRVFHGDELFLKPVERITQYKLGEK